MTAQRITVNLDEIREIAHKGVRRAAVFLGLGLNAAYDSALKEYRLSKIANIDLVPPDADEKTIASYKEEFSYWIIANGLRELVETFSVFLDQIHESFLLFKFTKGQLSRPQALEQRKKFHYAGLSDKLATLKEEFVLEPEKADHLISINRARNCLTHRRGIVGTKDVDKDKTLHMKWTGMEVFVKTPSGGEIPLIPGDFREPIEVKDGGDVMLRFLERSKTFKFGERVLLSPVDMAEICQVFAHEANNLCNRALERSREFGITNLKEEKPV